MREGGEISVTYLLGIWCKNVETCNKDTVWPQTVARSPALVAVEESPGGAKLHRHGYPPPPPLPPLFFSSK